MKFKNRIIIFSLLVLMLSISAASAHENIIADGNYAINDDMGSIDNLDDGIDDLDDDSDDWDDDDLDDDFDDWDGEDYDDLDDDSDDWDDDDSDDLDDDDSDDWDDDDLDDDSDDWDDDEDWDDWDDDDSDDWDDDEDWDDWEYSAGEIHFYKLISSCRDRPILVYKTTSLDKNMANGASSGSEDDSEDMDDDSQENFTSNDLQSFISTCLGTSASFEIPGGLSQNHGLVSKSISQSQNILANQTETDDDNDYGAVTMSADNDLGILGLLLSLLLSIVLLI